MLFTLAPGRLPSADQPNITLPVGERDERRRRAVEWPVKIARFSDSEWSGSEWILANGSWNTVAASSNDTPCVFKSAAAFVGSHSKVGASMGWASA
jgi:hypothetical protein